MIGFGTSPGKTHSADVRGGGGAGQALSCFVGAILTPYHMDYHKWLYRPRRLVAEVLTLTVKNSLSS